MGMHLANATPKQFQTCQSNAVKFSRFKRYHYYFIRLASQEMRCVFEHTIVTPFVRQYIETGPKNIQ